DCHVDHVNVRRACAVQKVPHPIPSPGRKAIQQGQTHRRSFIGKAAEFQLHLVQFRLQFRPTVPKRGMIPFEECAADLLNPLAHAPLSTPKTSSGESYLPWRNAEQESGERAQIEREVTPARALWILRANIFFSFYIHFAEFHHR